MQQTRECELGIFEPEPESSYHHLPMLVVPAAWYGVLSLLVIYELQKKSLPLFDSEDHLKSSIPLFR